MEIRSSLLFRVPTLLMCLKVLFISGEQSRTDSSNPLQQSEARSDGLLEQNIESAQVYQGPYSCADVTQHKAPAIYGSTVRI